jgi:hypothetical protein
MPLVTAFNLRREDPLSEIEEAVRHAMISIPALEIDEYEVDLVPICEPTAPSSRKPGLRNVSVESPRTSLNRANS